MEHQKIEKTKKPRPPKKEVNSISNLSIPQLIQELKQKGATELRQLLTIIEKAQNVLST